MRIVGLLLLQDFAKEHAGIRGQLNAWVSEVREATWRGPADVKTRYPTASFLSNNVVVFNLKRNKYRVDTKISYEVQVVLIRRIRTHAEYAKWQF